MEPSPQTILTELLTAAGVSFSGVEHTKLAGQDIYTIKTDDPKKLIGMRGDTIHALDHLVKKIYEEKHASPEGGEKTRAPLFLVDVDGYRSRQIEDLQSKVRMMAERARSFQYDVELSPMSSYERLIVHTTLQDEPNIKTESQGEGRGRRVIIKYAA